MSRITPGPYDQALDTNEATAKERLGHMVYKPSTSSGITHIRTYRYAQAKDAVTYVATHALEWANATFTAFTNDVAGGSSIGVAAGGATMVYTTAYYGWVQVAGYFASMLTDGNVTAGKIVRTGSADGTAIAFAVDGATETTVEAANAYYPRWLGVAPADDSSTLGPVFIRTYAGF